MGKIKVTGCEIEGVKVIEPEMFGDERGWFMEAWHKEDYEEAGIECAFVQDNRSYSRKGVLRERALRLMGNGSGSICRRRTESNYLFRKAWLTGIW